MTVSRFKIGRATESRGIDIWERGQTLAEQEKQCAAAMETRTTVKGGNRMSIQTVKH